MGFTFIKALPEPDEVKAALPLPEKYAALKKKR